MRVYPLNWNVDQAVRRKVKIDPRPAYQRAPVWNKFKKQLLIDTVLRKYDIPKIYLRKLPEKSPHDHEIVDGQQRLRTLWDFVEDKFELGNESEDLPLHGDLSGKKYSDLSTDTQDEIGLFQLTVQEVQDATEEEIRDLFRRLQEGVSLTPAEKRHALLGSMRDFISNLAGETESSTPHPVFPLTRIPSTRYKWEDLAAHVVRLELAGGPADVKAADLLGMYQAQESFDQDGAIARRIGKALRFMARVLHNRPPEMNIKWGFVDLYLLVSRMLDEYDLRDRASDFEAFYIGFEKDRRAVEDPAELIERGRDDWDRDLYDYLGAFQREGATRANIETRHEVYRRRALRDIPDLAPRDRRRAFSREERVIIWRRDDGICQECHEDVAFDDMHADHVVAHAAGGQTVIDNGRTLCASCNLSRGTGGL